MSRVSTGTGLVILGGCILGAAALSSPQLEKSAEAAGEATNMANVKSRIQVPHKIARAAPAPKGVRQPNCQVEVAQWFSPTPHLFEPVDCAGDVTRSQRGFLLEPHDLLGDGRTRMLESSVYGTDITIDVVEVRLNMDGSSTQLRTRILSAADTVLRENLAALGGYFYDLGQHTGWADVDGDGDLDLCFEAEPAGGWLENIAGGPANNNPYDHDGDGSVNTADLSLLLLNFD